jgi:hypothetical protein
MVSSGANHFTLMDAALLYMTGEEVHAGDRVQYGGTPATVVAVSDGEGGQFSPGYEDYSGTDRGIVICDDDGTLTVLYESDEKLEFIERA